MTLQDAGRLLAKTGRFLAHGEVGVVEAALIALDNRGDVPVLIGLTDTGVEVRVPLHNALAIGGAA